MSATNDGGPAFPPSIAVGPAGDVYTSSPDNSVHSGLSVRDWFAGQALIGATLAINDGLIDTSHAGVARMAYLYADAMIAERIKAGTP